MSHTLRYVSSELVTEEQSLKSSQSIAKKSHEYGNVTLSDYATAQLGDVYDARSYTTVVNIHIPDQHVGRPEQKPVECVLGSSTAASLANGIIASLNINGPILHIEEHGVAKSSNCVPGAEDLVSLPCVGLSETCDSKEDAQVGEIIEKIFVLSTSVINCIRAFLRVPEEVLFAVDDYEAALRKLRRSKRILATVRILDEEDLADCTLDAMTALQFVNHLTRALQQDSPSQAECQWPEIVGKDRVQRAVTLVTMVNQTVFT